MPVVSASEIERAKQEAEERNRPAVVLAYIGAALVAATLASMVLAQLCNSLAGIGVCGLIVAVGISIGSLFGFLFSVPRILAKDSQAQAALAAASSVPARNSADANQKRERLLSSNTNLERISEWLTTMLVGVGLTQIGSLDRAFSQFSRFLGRNAQVFGTGAAANAGILPAVGPFLLVCGLVIGFIFFYLYTRLYLSPLFQRVEVLFAEEPGGKPLNTNVEDFKEAAGSVASESIGMAYTSIADEISINDSLAVIKNVLYQPGGYTNAIFLGKKLVPTPAVKIAYYWYLMAAAYGQKFHALKQEAGSEREQGLARLAVLDAARKAVQIDARYKKALKELTVVSEYDNDLQDFSNDDEFLRIVR